MTDTSRIFLGCPGDRALSLIAVFFRGVLAAAVILTLLILFIPGPDFLTFSNVLQVIAAAGGSIAFLYCWYACGHRESFLWAAYGFGLWGIANIAWYVNVFLGLRALVFPSLIDLGMIASFLLLAVAFRSGFSEKDPSLYLSLAIVTASLIVPVAVILMAGTIIPALVTLLYFLACGIFLAACVRYPGIRSKELFFGSLLFALAFMAYPLREMFSPQAPFLNILGTMVSAGFALIVTGWPLAASKEDDKSDIT